MRQLILFSVKQRIESEAQTTQMEMDAKWMKWKSNPAINRTDFARY